jgi:FkbM family methyltransferase
MSTLVYIGTNEGDGLSEYIDLYDQVYAFEPDPEIFKILVDRFKDKTHAKFINCACSDTAGVKTLYVTENRHSTSLSELSDYSLTHGFSGGKSSFKTFEVNCVNLKDFFEENQINYIDTLITDCQGSDLSILKTIKSYIDDKKISEFFCETHAVSVELYSGLNNQFLGFKELLSENYEVKDFYLDGKLVSKDGEPFVEWDTHWILKDDII